MRLHAAVMASVSLVVALNPPEPYDWYADDVEREALTAMRSAPVDPPERGRMAVNIVTATGMPTTTVREVEARSHENREHNDRGL